MYNFSIKNFTWSETNCFIKSMKIQGKEAKNVIILFFRPSPLEVVQFLLDKGFGPSAGHYNPMMPMCSFCRVCPWQTCQADLLYDHLIFLVQFDAILKMETFSSDLKFVFNLLNKRVKNISGDY